MTYERHQLRPVPLPQAVDAGGGWARLDWRVTCEQGFALADLVVPTAPADQVPRLVVTVVPETAETVRVSLLSESADDPGNLTYASLFLQSLGRVARGPFVVDGIERHPVLTLAKFDEGSGTA